MNNDYNHKFLSNIKKMLPLLKETFITFYGEKYRDTIIERLDSIRIFFVESDGTFCKDINDFGSLNDSEKSKLIALKDLEKTGGCLIPDIFPPLIVLKVTKPLSLHYLIHEINHSLHMSKIENDILSLFAMFNQNNIKTSVGFSEMKYDYFYELINEYMTYDLLEIARKKIGDDENINTNYDELCYLYLDKVVNNYVKKFYCERKDRLKEVLINLKGEEYYEEFGRTNWKNVSKNFERIENLFFKYLCYSDIENMDENLIYSEAIIFLFNKISNLDLILDDDSIFLKIIDDIIVNSKNKSENQSEKKR